MRKELRAEKRSREIGSGKSRARSGARPGSIYPSSEYPCAGLSSPFLLFFLPETSTSNILRISIVWPRTFHHVCCVTTIVLYLVTGISSRRFHCQDPSRTQRHGGHGLAGVVSQWRRSLLSGAAHKNEISMTLLPVVWIQIRPWRPKALPCDKAWGASTESSLSVPSSPSFTRRESPNDLHRCDNAERFRSKNF